LDPRDYKSFQLPTIFLYAQIPFRTSLFLVLVVRKYVDQNDSNFEKYIRVYSELSSHAQYILDTSHTCGSCVGTVDIIRIN
jgi:hypothetical protein